MTADADPPLGLWQRPLPWVLLCVLPVLVWSLLPGNPRIAGLFHDDGSYAQLGKSLVERGVYRDAHYPAAVETAKYPPGVPLFVAAGLWIGGDLGAALTFVRIINCAFLALALFAFFAILRRAGLRQCAPLLLIAIAWGGMSLDFVRACMSEIPYLGVSLFAIHRLQRVRENSAPWRAAMELAGLVFAAFLLRSFAVVLAIAIVLHLLWHRRVGIVWRFLALSATPIVWLQTFMSAASLPKAGYEDVTVYGLSYSRIFLESLDWVDATLITNGLRTVIYSVHHVVPVARWLPLQEDWAVAVAWLLVIVLLGLVVVGVRSELVRRQGLQPGHLVVLGTYLLVLPWPANPLRFLIPIVPFLLLFVVQGVGRFAGSRGAFVAAVVLALCSVVDGVPGRLSQSPEAMTMFGRPRNTTILLEQAERLRKLPKGSVVASTFDSTLAAHADIRGVWGWTITADEHLYQYAPGRGAFGLAWQFEPWVRREMTAAHGFFLRKLGKLDPRASVPAPKWGADREPLLLAFEQDRERVLEQFKRLGVTHAAISVHEGAGVYEVLLARMVRWLEKDGRAEVDRELSSDFVQVWRIRI